MRRAALLVLAGAFAVTLLPGPWGDVRITDVPIYRDYADQFLAGHLPYRDVPFEYPPLAAVVIAVPGVGGTDWDTYRAVLAASMAALAAALVLLTGTLAGRTGGERSSALLAAAAAPLLTGAMIRTHFDLAPTTLTLAALALLVAGRARTGFAVLGLAVVTKGFPVVVAPVALWWLVSRNERRRALEGLAALVATVAVVAGAALALSPSGAADGVDYHLDRPVQVESTPALALLAVDALGGPDAMSVHSFGSDGLEHPASGAVTVLFGALLLGAVVLLAAGGARRRDGRPPEARELVLASLAAVAAFAALGKVLSPQFLVWVIPLGALALAWGMYALAGLTATAIVLTLAEFPVHYGDVVAREPLAIWLVAVRDAALVGAVALAARELLATPARAPARGAGGSPWRGRPRRPRPAPR